MISNLVGWFKTLSVAGKAGVVTGAVVVGGTGASAVTSPPAQPVKEETNTLAACTPQMRSETESETIGYSSKSVEDSALEKGKTTVSTKGINGEKKLTYEIVEYSPQGCKPNEKTVKEEKTVKNPVTEITKIGAYVAPKPEPVASNCNPNYSGCVPNASDVDCAGGSGNGPEYTGRTTVIGADVYDLDRDGDGVACE